MAQAVDVFRFIHRAEERQFGIGRRLVLFGRQVVDTHHHVFGGADNRFTAAGLEQILAGKHQLPGLIYRRLAQRHMHGHLVTVKICVERVAD